MIVFMSLIQLNRMDDAINDCSNAIELDDTYIKAYLRRAKWYKVLAFVKVYIILQY